MIFTFLGTSAANAFPEAFCRCHNCEQARKLGGASLRKRSAALVNDDLLIDLGPDIMTASQAHGCSLTKVSCCLQTHPHADHLDLSHLQSRSLESGTIGTPCLHFYASPETVQRAAQTFERDLEGYGLLSPEAEKRLNLRVHSIKALKPFTFGRYRVTAFPANHAPAMGAMLYAVEADGQTVFYGADTASLPEPTWQAFHKHQMRFDLVILDHTYGPNQEGSDHLSAHQVIDHVARMRGEGLMTHDARAFATHIAHEGNPTHQELASFARQHGYEVAYDGLLLEI
jgi:phosphoribosyl 1,2-cyclic phosphate phosphodiesterase